MEDCGHQFFRHRSSEHQGLDPRGGTSTSSPPRHVAKMHTLKNEEQSGTVVSMGHVGGAAGLCWMHLGKQEAEM